MREEERRARLLEKANTLPLTPGVYLMRDRTGRVIYVGKSRRLKQRVSQYFQNSHKNVKTEQMTAHVADFDYFLCDNEMEALSLTVPKRSNRSSLNSVCFTVMSKSVKRSYSNLNRVWLRESFSMPAAAYS